MAGYSVYKPMGRFWVDDDFVRKHVETYKLSLKAIAVYIALCSHADKNGHTFVGHRTIAKEMGINKDSVTRGMGELEASGLVRRLKGKNGQASETIIQTVRNDTFQPSETVRPKEGIKEVFKEEEISLEQKQRAEAIKQEIRAKFKWT